MQTLTLSTWDTILANHTIELFEHVTPTLPSETPLQQITLVIEPSGEQVNAQLCNKWLQEWAWRDLTGVVSDTRLPEVVVARQGRYAQWDADLLEGIAPLRAALPAFSLEYTTDDGLICAYEEQRSL